MNKQEYNNKAINDVYKNAHIALQSISDILPAVKDDNLKNELKEQYEGYEKIIGKISSYIKQVGIDPKDVNPMQKAFMWSSIKLKTLFNKSKNQIAELMIKGTVTGITELTAMKNEAENLDEEVLELIKELLALEEKYEQRLKKFL